MNNFPCLICSVVLRETHCGFDVCRACASFFKRTQQSGKRYICRQGDGKCQFRKHWNGMITSSILDLIKREYNESVSRRMLEELRLVKLYQLPVVDATPNRYQSTLNYYYAMFPIIVRELKIFLRSLIPDFDQFSDHLKTTILCSVVGKFNTLEIYYRTSKQYKEYGKCMCTLLTCFDLMKCEEWLTENEIVTRKRDLISAKRSYASENLLYLHQMMKMGTFTETEFYALIVIAFCDMDSTIYLPDRINGIFENIRSKVFIELQNYYRKELRIDDFSTRLGRLMTLSAVITEFHNNCYEQHNMFAAMFDIKSQCDLLLEAMN